MTTATTSIPNVGTLAAALEASQWRNLAFDKAGRSHLGVMLFGGQAEAEKHMAALLLRSANRKREGQKTNIETMGGPVPFDDYVWHMQIPIIA